MGIRQIEVEGVRRQPNGCARPKNIFLRAALPNETTNCVRALQICFVDI